MNNQPGAIEVEDRTVTEDLSPKHFLTWPLAVVTVMCAIALALVMVVPGCKTVSTAGGTVISDAGHIAADCGKVAVHDIAIHIVDDVTTALATTDYTGGIVAIVTKLVANVAPDALPAAEDAAWQAVKCAVAEIEGQVNVHLAYGKMDSQAMIRESVISQHANQWMANH